ncbi:MAG: GAF domain-containing protein [Myxococcales bacterium FL481]|nr:MAG: GAF domain-containing protein [Myxococcales bacterium FL481]
MTSIYESLPSLLAATVAFAIGTSVVLRDRSRDQFVSFAVFCFNIGVYHLAQFFFGFSEVELFQWAAQTVSLVLPWSADRCFAGFVPAGGRKPGRWQTALLLGLVVAQVVVLVLLVTQGGTDLRGPGNLPPMQLLSVGVGGYVLIGLLLAVTRMWRAAKAAGVSATAARLRYLFYASLVALVLGSPLIPLVGSTVTAVYLYFVAQTLVRERLLDLPEIVARIATLTTMVTGVTALFALLLLWVPIEARGVTPTFLFNIVVASFAVIVLIDPVRTELESRIEAFVFRDRSAFRSLLVQLRFSLLNVIDPQEMVDLLINTLRESNRVTHASLYLLDAHGTHMVSGGRIGGSGPSRLDLATRRPLFDRMRIHGPLLRDVVQREHDRTAPEARTELDEILETFAELDASLAVPIRTQPDGPAEPRAEPELMGVLFLHNERLLEPFTGEEVQLFENLAAQAAITLRNSTAYERRKERDRLAALGEMSAGLAHEIRNPLGAIKGAVQVVQPAMGELDGQTAEFLGVIVEEVDRLNRVVTQFLSYARPFTGELEELDVREVVRATVRLIAADRADAITLALPEDLPATTGDPDALRQVFHNLVLNALDAIAGRERGRVWIEARVQPRRLPSGDAVAVSVRDNGPGLSSHTMTHLFVPFHTTKSGGTGLGLPISQRIVENHHGAIEVTGTLNAGATFTVLLPVRPERKQT